MYHNYSKATVVVAVVGIISAANAFVPIAPTTIPSTRAAATTFVSYQSLPKYQSTQLFGAQDDDAQDNEIERLKRQAAKLRAEAASLEADKAKQLAVAAEKAFNRFDANSDGEVTLSELKLGLEKELKVRIFQLFKQIQSYLISNAF
jgi:hypothetical protein